MKKIDNKYLDFYNENGYLIVENVIDDKECDYFLNLFKEYSLKNGNKEFSEIPQVHRCIPETLRLMKNEKVVDIIESLLDGESVGLQTVCGFKKPNTPSGNMAWNPHQDGTYIDIDKEKYVSGDIVLDDHKEDSGVLYVYPGSHKEDLLDYEPNKSFGDLKGNPGNRVLNVPNKYSIKKLILKKGSFLSFHSNLIHGSYKNTSKSNWRPILLMAFMRSGASYNPGQKAKRTPIELR